jgi:hypothetical protein
MAFRAAVLGCLVAACWAAIAGRERERVRARHLATLCERQAERLARLEGELQEAMRSRQDVAGLVAQRVEAEREARTERAARERRALAPMPEGVRLALDAIHACLRASGHDGIKFFHASALVERTLLNAEVFDVRGAAGTDVYLAERVGLALDRARGTLTIAFTGGAVLTGGLRRDIPPAGLAIELAGVDGRAWEQRLPYLVEARNEYPPVEDEIRATPRLDGDTRLHWLERLNRLLRSAGTDLRYQVRSFSSLEGSSFLDALVMGLAEGNRLDQTAEVKRLSIVVDRRSATVELLLADGILRKRGGETSLGGDGYRILLPGVTPEAALDTMLGMVSER